ncbi:MAG: hypothetical protein C3F18_05585 [Nitrosomonadales bacterium]|nr:MAG: hypothetical protein C3F18_05585 [Nitrosomonadales bacterium]
MLPGGIQHQGSLRRDYDFRPLTGEVEMGLAEAVARARDLPGQVTLALQAALAHVGGRQPDAAVIDGMSVGDRQFLMTRLAGVLGLDQVWLTASCRHCGEPFDFPLNYDRLPVKPAGSGFPDAHISTERGMLTLRVPNGMDQRAVLGIAGMQLARQTLAKRCVTAWDGGDLSTLELDAGEVTAIEAALESVAPEIATEVMAPCPECGAENRVGIDPYFCLGRVSQDLFGDVHRLASHYHWSEAEILVMPRWRRHRYLALIDRSRGMMQ